MRRIPKDDTDLKAIKQIVMGEYGYAVNALWEKQVIKELILKKLTRAISTECDGLCSLKSPSMLRNTSSESLKTFNEKSHVAEIRERAPVLAAVLAAASRRKQSRKQQLSKTTKNMMPWELMLTARNQWQLQYYFVQGAQR